MNYSFNILVSCMHEKDFSIIEKSNIKCDALVVNQCDRNNVQFISEFTKWIDTTERGLSNSRNMAIQNSDADICLIADNDEVFDIDVKDKILNAYKELRDADIIIFDLYNKPNSLKNKIYKLSRLDMLRVSSWQITFKKDSIKNKNIKFDPKLGAGTGNGGGEENKFLLDCYDKGLVIYHYPINIARMIDNESTWFKGYNAEYFYKRGMSTRYILGFWLSCLYGIYFLVFKRKMYTSTISIMNAAFNLYNGILSNKLRGD